MSTSTDLIGQTIGGYQLIEAVGSGAMATVYKAYQPNLERWVALKILHFKESSALIRFQREAKAVAMLRHRNILIVYEYGEEGDWPFIVMEYVDGGALSDRLDGQPQEWARVINLLIPVAEALHYAHGQGVIHRDVKPSNILLPQPDWPLLADFGLVKLPTSTQQVVTRTGTSMGTPAYIAPEQARGVAVDHRADIYSLGVILFEMITGRLPFDYANPNKVLLAHISEPVPSPCQLNPNCPAAIEDVIMRAMQKQPDKRYSDMNQMIAALQDIVASSSIRPPFYAAEAMPPLPPPPQSNPALHTLPFSDPPDTAPLTSPAGTQNLEARILLTGQNTSLAIPNKEQVIIGRTHRTTIADVDLSPYGAAEAGISRRHACLIRQGNTWAIDDLGSMNGTYINETQVRSGNPIPLKNGDVVRCSHLSFVFLVSNLNQ